MKTLYVDCKYGISGDMMLTSLVDLGADVAYIQTELRKLPIAAFDMSFEKIVKQGVACQQLKLSFGPEASVGNMDTHHGHSHHHNHDHTHHGNNSHHHDHDHTHHTHSHNEGHLHHHHDDAKGSHHDHHEHSEGHDHSHHHNEGHDHNHHHAAEILAMIETSNLPKRVKERSLSLFGEVARAEGKIHGMDPSEVHFHEVGAMDSIIDTIGVCLALESLEVDELIFHSVPTGSGMIQIAHGLYPVPAPATAEILVGVPLADFDYPAELTTPTGASFAKILANSYAQVPSGTIEKIGYGCGTKEFPHPNVLRTMLIKKKNKFI